MIQMFEFAQTNYHDCLTFIAQLHDKVQRIYMGGKSVYCVRPQMQKLI